MFAYHCTTRNKLKRYKDTGGILAPVRFWPSLEAAQSWCKKTGRPYIVQFPMPVEKKLYPGHFSEGQQAFWIHNMVRYNDMVIIPYG